MSQINSDDYGARYIYNAKVEWLIEYGRIRDVVYFRGAIGDRWTIYVALSAGIVKMLSFFCRWLK